MPKATRNLNGQAKPQLTRNHHNLSPVMALMGDEIAKNVPNVERKVAPGIGGGGRDSSTVLNAKLEQAQNSRAASLQCWDQVLWLHLVPIDARRNDDAMLFAERLDPHTPGIVEMTGKHSDAATWGSGNLRFPEFRRQMLHEKDRDTIISFPYVKNRVSQA